MRAIVLIVLVGLAAAGAVSLGGGGIDAAGGTCDAGAVRAHGGDIASTPGCNPNHGRLLGHCVVLSGDGWAPSMCGQAPTGPDGQAVRYVEAPAGPGALSDDQIRQLWLGAGGDPAQSRMAVAIARAESGGRPDAIGHNTNGTVDRGVWQVNSIHGPQSTLDPVANARAAVAISSNGTNWGPWTTYGSGAYRKFL